MSCWQLVLLYEGGGWFSFSELFVDLKIHASLHISVVSVSSLVILLLQYHLLILAVKAKGVADTGS